MNVINIVLERERRVYDDTNFPIMIPAENMDAVVGYRKAITTYFQYEVAIKVVYRFISRTNSSVLTLKNF